MRENKKGWQVPSDIAQYKKTRYKKTAKKNNVILQEQVSEKIVWSSEKSHIHVCNSEFLPNVLFE